MTNTETATPERDIVHPGEPFAQDAPAAQLPVESRLFDRAGGIEASIGGLRIESLAQVMDVAKLMSQAATAVPEHCRGNTGICFALCLQALEWKMSPFAVANKSYVVNDRLNYESQLVHAVIEARAPLRERLRVRYEGEGEESVCVVSGWFRGEPGPREHRSPPLKEARPPTKIKDGKEVRKGSPLWDKKPLVQLFYDTSRDFCRIYCPDVLMGIYTPDEVEQYEIGNGARDVTAEADAASALHQRLAATAKNGEGFRDGVVEAGLGEVVITSPAPGERVSYTIGQSGSAGSHGEPRGAPATAGDSHPATQPQKRATARATGKAKAPKSGKQADEAPTDAEGYYRHFTSWLALTEDAEEIETRWKNEWKLRKACGVGGGEAGTQLLNQKNARVKAVSREFRE